MKIGDKVVIKNTSQVLDGAKAEVLEMFEEDMGEFTVSVTLLENRKAYRHGDQIDLARYQVEKV